MFTSSLVNASLVLTYMFFIFSVVHALPFRMRIRKFQGFLVAAQLLAALILLQSASIEGAGECNSNPCLYGSTCEPTTNGYTCACVDHTTGIHCETGTFTKPFIS